LTIKSKALEINLANYKVDVSIDAKYSILQEIMASYFGLLDRLNTFLKELSHPYKNWAFIVKESRALCLDYFYLLKGHSRGYQAAHLYVDIFIDAIKYSNDSDVRTNATDNLLLFLIKIIQDSGNFFDQFTPVIDYALYSVYRFEEKFFQLFVHRNLPQCMLLLKMRQVDVEFVRKKGNSNRLSEIAL